MTDQTGHPDDQEPDVSGDQLQDDQQQADSEPAPKPSFKDRFKDKTPEELLDILEEKERFIGEQTTQIGDYKSRVESLESSQVSGGAQVEPDYRDEPFSFTPPSRPTPGYGSPMPSVQPSAVDPSKLEFNFEKPVESTREVVRQELAAFQMGSMAREFQSNINRAKHAFSAGSKKAMSKNKRLFGGIEKDVLKMVENFYTPDVMRGVPVDTLLMTDDPWVKAAQNIRLDRGEFDKLQPEKIQPMTAPRTEHPDSAQPGPKGSSKRFTEVDWNSDEVRQWMKVNELSRKEAEEIIAETQEAYEKGDLR